MNKIFIFTLPHPLQYFLLYFSYSISPVYYSISFFLSSLIFADFWFFFFFPFFWYKSISGAYSGICSGIQLNSFVQEGKPPGNHRFCLSKGWAELPKTHPWARLWSASFLISIPYFFTYFQRLVIVRLFHNFLMKSV